MKKLMLLRSMDGGRRGVGVSLIALRKLSGIGAADVWWEVAGETIVAAYQPKGADDLADSYINLANPGTNDAAPGVAPTWDAVNGWIFNGSTQYLTTGMNMPDGSTLLIRYSDWDIAAGADTLFAQYTSGSARWYVEDDGSNARLLRGSSIVNYASLDASGVLGMADNDLYLGGVKGGANTGTTNTGSGNLLIAAHPSGPTNFANAKIQAIAIYSTTLDAAQMAALTTAMNAL